MLDSKVSAILMRQLPLPISAAAKPSLDNYVAGANAEALEHVRSLHGRAEGSRRLPVGRDREPPHLRAAASANPALVTADDVDSLDAAAQQALFSAINAAREGGPRSCRRQCAADAARPARRPAHAPWVGLVYRETPRRRRKALYLRNEASRRGSRSPTRWSGTSSTTCRAIWAASTPSSTGSTSTRSPASAP